MVLALIYSTIGMLGIYFLMALSWWVTELLYKYGYLK